MADDLPVRGIWAGWVSNRQDPDTGPFIRARVEGAKGGWSSSIKVSATDGNDYFAKFPEKSIKQHPLGCMSLAVEVVASAAGKLIGAPMCDAVLLRIPTDLIGKNDLLGDEPTTSTVVHASRALANADEQPRPRLQDRDKDDNSRRHVGIYAMWDWFMGSDPQWLRDITNDDATYSHDHGMYLPPENHGYWTEQDLQNRVNDAHRLCDDPQVQADSTGLSSEAIIATAAKLRAIDRPALARILNRVPVSWPVTNEDLEGLGWFLESRAPAVAGRIESLRT